MIEMVLGGGGFVCGHKFDSENSVRKKRQFMAATR